ncbi:MAG: DUF2339 domain-containing protein [Bacteroidota bacterium]
MEFLFVIVLVLVVILLIKLDQFNNRINKRFDEISKQLYKLNLPQKTETTNRTAERPVVPPPVEVVKPITFEPPVVMQEPVRVPQPVRPPEPVVEKQPVTVEEPIELYRLSFWDKFKVANPDLEKFIGENLISKIGIGILVLGIAFFVKYAIDKNWINETARVGIGVLCGLIVNAVAHRLRIKFKAFSSVLVSGAIAIYYFTIAIGFQEYHIFSQTVAFVLMIVITIFSTLVSLAYNRQELAVLSLIGGFATPLMVSTGSGNYIVLFTYLLMLDIGILVIAYLRKWNIVNVCTYGFTILFYLVWVFQKVFNVHVGVLPLSGALLFATLFYVVFVAMVLVNDLKERRAFSSLELALLLSNTAIYYGVGMKLMHLGWPMYQGLFTVLMAVFNLGLGWLVFKKYKADTKLVYLLIGLALTFVTLAAPVQLKGNSITLFWAAETLLLLWLSVKSNMRNFFFTSTAVLFLTLISLLIDWVKYYGINVSNDVPVLLNRIFLTGLFTCLSLYVQHRLLKQDGIEVRLSSFKLNVPLYRNFIRAVMIILLYLVGISELSYQLNMHLPFKEANSAVVLAYHFVFTSVVLIYIYRYPTAFNFSMVLIAALFNMLIYGFFYTSILFQTIEDSLVSLQVEHYSFGIHLIAFLAIIVHFMLIYRVLTNERVVIKINKKGMSWMMAILIVFILTGELQYFLAVNKVDEWIKPVDLTPFDLYLHYTTQVVKTGWPILWSILSILFLVWGIKKQNKTMRIIALFLQAVTIFKLFIYDINNVSEAGKIIAFIILGIILLIMSFMYQKIKAIILYDEKQDAEKQ